MTRPLRPDQRRNAPGAGRRPLRGTPASMVITVRLTPDEHAAAIRATNGAPVAAWARTVLLMHLRGLE